MLLQQRTILNGFHLKLYVRRFDEVFFLALPTKEERKAIFDVHLQKSRPGKLENFQLPLFSDLSKDFSGAEIEQVVIEAMRLG